jgi:hypothetical protein
MSQMPKLGTRVRVESKGSWPREGYRVATVDIHEGEVVPSFSWLGDDYLCITSDDLKIPVRAIKINSIIRILTSGGETFKPAGTTAHTRGSWTVKGSKGATYVVTRSAGSFHCNCPAGGFGRACKHVREVQSKQC